MREKSGYLNSLIFFMLILRKRFSKTQKKMCYPKVTKEQHPEKRKAETTFKNENLPVLS